MELDNSQNLLAAVIGGNSSASNAAARRLIRHFGSVQALASASKEEMRIIGKISDKQASTLQVALELGREACSSPLRAGESLSSSSDLFHRYKARFFNARREYFFSLHLNSKNQLKHNILASIFFNSFI